MLNEKVLDALNNQIKMEGDSSQVYLAMASWAEVQGFDGISTFMYKQSDEERLHMLKLIKYVNQRGGAAKVSATHEPSLDLSNYKALF